MPVQRLVRRGRWEMTTDVYLALAIAALAAHLLFNLWVVFGAAATRRRPKLAGLHIGSVLYGTVMENAPWSCPLTLAENLFKARAGCGGDRNPPRAGLSGARWGRHGRQAKFDHEGRSVHER